MPAVIAMLRAVNLAGHNRIKMDALCALCTSLKLRDARTYVQSGNVVFRTSKGELARVTKRLGDGIEQEFGFRTEVIVRSTAEMRDVVARNPFAKRRGIEPGKLLVLFFAERPGPEAREKILGLKADNEEFRLDGRELYGYYPNGMGRSKVPTPIIERKLKSPGTGRNWNSVLKLLEMAEELDRL